MRRSNASYRFAIDVSWLTMKDGVRLSVTLFRPLQKRSGERFPVLLEMLPYRKDDSFYLRDYPIYAYFARAGFIMAKVDVRGTGSSEGAVPNREYSDAEIQDAIEVIAQLANRDDANGHVGMWGISWGGFNAIQVAMHRPAHLHAIAAFHASDDLFHDDVRFIDGAFHINHYALEIDHELGLPATPEYIIDARYLKERFSSRPWFLTYLNQQQDSEFWRRKSLRFQYDAVNVPIYLVGGLLDGYRDTVPRMLANMTVPIRAEIGPWNHDFPDTGKPGPNYDWRKNMVAFFQHELSGRKKTRSSAKRVLTMFVRSGHAPDANLKETPGDWQVRNWPLEKPRVMRLYPIEAGRLARTSRKPYVDELAYVPTAGVQAGRWWGEPTGDMRAADAHSLVYDSDVLKRPVTIAGFSKVRMKASVDTNHAHFVARLEDVDPSGQVSLVTGAVLNGSQRESRLEPSFLEPNQTYDLSFDLHFTTWTFRPGHKIRLSISNSQFPMIWPTPKHMTMSLHLGKNTSIDLPLLGRGGKQPELPKVEAREMRPDARELKAKRCGANCCFDRHVRDRLSNTVSVLNAKCERFIIGKRRYKLSQKLCYKANDNNPARAEFEGEMVTTIKDKDFSLALTTTIKVTSDEKFFHARVTRKLMKNGKHVTKRVWKEKIPRRFN